MVKGRQVHKVQLCQTLDRHIFFAKSSVCVCVSVCVRACLCVCVRVFVYGAGMCACVCGEIQEIVTHSSICILSCNYHNSTALL